MDSPTNISPANPHPNPLPAYRKRENNGSLGPYWRGLAVCLAIFAVYIATIFLLHTETATRSTAPPWYSWVRRPPKPSLFLLFPVIVFAGWIKFVRGVLDKPIKTETFLILACVAVFTINVTTAMMDGGADAIWKPFDRPGAEYFGDVAVVHNVGSFLQRYVGNQSLGIHNRTHPPGAVLLLYFISRIFGPGIRAAAWSAVVITATGVIPFFFLARKLVSERVAKIAVALYALTTSLVIFGATSMDGVFLVSMLWSIYFLQRLIVTRSIGMSLAAGVSLAISFFLSYVTICVAALMLVYALREWWSLKRCLVISAITTIVLLASLYPLTGFNYLACLQASRNYDHYLMRTSSMTLGRYLDISFSNLFAFLIGVGFPVIVLWWKQTRHPGNSFQTFNLAGIFCVLFFSFARLFTHETERIWMFFIPVALISAALWIDRQRGRLLEWTITLLFIQTFLFQLFLFTMW